MTRRVLCGEFSHKTNTFSVQPADVAACERRLCIIGDEAPLARDNTNNEMGDGDRGRRGGSAPVDSRGNRTGGSDRDHAGSARERFAVPTAGAAT